MCPTISILLSNGAFFILGNVFLNFWFVKKQLFNRIFIFDNDPLEQFTLYILISLRFIKFK